MTEHTSKGTTNQNKVTIKFYEHKWSGKKDRGAFWIIRRIIRRIVRSKLEGLWFAGMTGGRRTQTYTRTTRGWQPAGGIRRERVENFPNRTGQGAGSRTTTTQT
ncbi:uncharacterized protein LOC120414578 [Culex pipiens pallens]|uniref:uncharacterized protein LOC120414578 n=1 Tax=Culex pipiens pallens TaxID=42434 RepID=UPI0022AA2917|nr:uncharacterized protein LOC120414578 [Culex pipiens pallens]